MLQTRIPLSLVVGGLLAALPTVAGAVDGVLEINQTCDVQTGCFAGDEANRGVGIQGGAGSLVTNSTVASNGDAGIFVGAHSRVAGNLVTGNGGAGISVTGQSAIEGNSAHDNAGFGIACSPGCSVVGNSATGNAIAECAPTPASVSGDWLVRAQRSIAARDRASESRGGLQAPNRAHDLRTYFGPMGIRVHDRTGAGEPGAALAVAPALRKAQLR